jgi:hypothetical protein
MRNSTINRNAQFFNAHRRPSFRSVISGAPTMFKVMSGFIAVMFILVIGAIAFSGIQHLTQVNAYENCTVSNVHFAIDEDGFETYRVLSSCGSFTADGDLRYGSVSGAALISNIVEGETYNFTATGMNQPNLGILPNIVEATLIR